jgi:hypothetical protein
LDPFLPGEAFDTGHVRHVSLLLEALHFPSKLSFQFRRQRPHPVDDAK